MKHYEALKELIDSELGDSSYYTDNMEIHCESCEGDYYEKYRLKIETHKRNYDVIFRCRNNKIEVCISDDVDKWEETNEYSHLVKWFWIALLS